MTKETHEQLEDTLHKLKEELIFVEKRKEYLEEYGEFLDSTINDLDWLIRKITYEDK